MAIWPDGTQQILHYEVASQESQEHWENFFENLVKRGFNSEQVKLVVRDSTTRSG
jgi:transposase-like protein